VTHPLQALVTERLKPFLHVVIVSATLHVYVNQTDRGESSSARRSTYASYSMRSTLRFRRTRQRTRWSCSRAWAGSRCCGSGPASATMPPDFAPIIGPVAEVDGFLLDVGWGTYGFKAGPAAGSRVRS